MSIKKGGNMFNKFILGVTILILFSCTNSTEPEPSNEFSKIEIHYARITGFSGDANRLDIFGDGTIQRSNDPVKTGLQDTLTTAQKDTIIQLFSNFSQYDPSYSGSVADANNHIIEYIYEGKTKTVDVYAPGDVYIPESLWNIIRYLDDLLFNLILN